MCKCMPSIVKTRTIVFMIMETIMHYLSIKILIIPILAGLVVSPAHKVYAEKIDSDEVLIIGDSFFAMTGEIKQFLEQHAREDGVIGENEQFRSQATSGAWISGISDQYSNASPKPKWVIMDAGGNDCLNGEPQAAVNEVQPLLDKMRENGTEKVLWMRYPEPQGSFAGGDLKNNLDVLMPQVKDICDASTNPEVLWVDLRPVWEMNSSYTSDGIHPTTEGSRVTADAFWDKIMETNFFDIVDVDYEQAAVENTSKSVVLNKNINNDKISVSLSLNQPSQLTLRLITVSGRTVLLERRQISASGRQTVEFPLESIASGTYCCSIIAGKEKTQSMLYVE